MDSLAYMLTGFHLSFARTEADDWFDSLDGWMTLSPGFKFTVRRMVRVRRLVVSHHLYLYWYCRCRNHVLVQYEKS